MKGALEAQLAVRRLAPALAGVAIALFEQLNGRRRDRLVYVAAAQAGAVSAVPILLKEHGPTTSGTASRQSGLH